MTIVFSNSIPKIPKSSNFGPKSKDFCFSTRFSFLKDLRVLISKMSKVLSNFDLKVPK